MTKYWATVEENIHHKDLMCVCVCVCVCPTQLSTTIELEHQAPYGTLHLGS